MTMSPETCRRLSEALYARIGRDPILRPLFPGKTLRCAIEEFAAYLVQFHGGPAELTQKRWWLSIQESHRRFRIGRRERAAWLKNMKLALDDVQLADPALRDFFDHASAYLVNEGEPPAAAAKPDSAAWDTQLALDETVAAVRAGDRDRALALAANLRLDPSRRCGLLALMLGRFDDYVHGELRRDPTLVRARFGGRSLLHLAAEAGSLATIKLLIELGADPNASSAGHHTPLYSVANSQRHPDGAEIVRVLTAAGARVDAADGVMHCTPLHMAARRGNLEVARALLEAGANPEARDTRGDTPLQRAMKMRHPEVAGLLRGWRQAR